MRESLAPIAARPFSVRFASSEDQEALVSFAASFEQRDLPPAGEGWDFTAPAFVLVAIHEGKIVGALRVEGARRALVTHFLVSPTVEQPGLAVVLLEAGMSVAREAGAITIGGYLPAGSPLVAIAKELGGEVRACFLWVEGSLEAASSRSEPSPGPRSSFACPGPGGPGHPETLS